MKLTRLSNGNFKIIDGASSIEGSWPQIRAQMLFEFEVDQTQLDRAMEDMREKDNDTADFGINGTFQFSYRAHEERSAQEILIAIEQARQEFHECYSRGKESIETQEAARRLQMLYIALNVKGCLMAMGVKRAA